MLRGLIRYDCVKGIPKCKSVFVLLLSVLIKSLVARRGVLLRECDRACMQVWLVFFLVGLVVVVVWNSQ